MGDRATVIDDDVRELKRKVFWNKAYSLIAFILTTGLPLIPIVLIIFFKTGAFNRIAIITLVIIYLALIIFLIRHGARFVQRLTGAVPIGLHEFDSLKGLAEDISIATGKPLPELMVINDELCCNLFSIKRGKHAVIFIGPRIFEMLDRDELRAAIAHEMAHIHNGDAQINTATVSFRALSQIIMDRMPTLNTWKSGVLFVLLLYLLPLAVLAIAFVSEVAIVLLLISFLLFVCFYVFGHNFTLFLPSIELKRDFYADELTVKWTLQPEALIEAMQKAQMFDKSKKISFLEVIPFVPTVFDNPHKDMDSASVRERIDNLVEIARLPL